MTSPDTNTLNGALEQLGITMAFNLNNKGVSASASDGLTTLAGKINNIYTGECYFIDTLDTTDYILYDTSVSSVSIEDNSVKIENTVSSNQSVLFSLNRGPIIGNWKITYELKTSSQVFLYQRIAGKRTGNAATISDNVNLSSFKKVEWVSDDGDMSVTIDDNLFGSTTYTPDMYYPIFGFYFNQNEYVFIRNLKIIRI